MLSDEIKPLLFVREINKDERDLGVPYRYLGMLKRHDDVGERPIKITWDLLEADLIFTSNATGIHPIKQIGEKAFSTKLDKPLMKLQIL